jgi:histidinol-phosphate aminotransferase
MLYPDPSGKRLCAKIAQVYGIREPSILLANGSDEAIRLVFEAVLEKGDTTIIPFPTYTLYEVLARFRSATVQKVPFAKEFTLPPLPKEGKLLILPHPQVPSGVAFPLAQLEALVRDFEGLVVIDEAYVDFGAESAIPLLGRFDNVAILRTFSKSFSLAGLRVGFVAGPTWLIEALHKLKDSYNVGWLAQAGVLAALEDIGWMELNVKRIIETREFTRYHLLSMGFHVPESNANFLLAQKPGINLKPLYEGLRQRNILVRYFPTAELYDCIRISIGTPSKMEFFLETLRKVLFSLNS